MTACLLSIPIPVEYWPSSSVCPKKQEVSVGTLNNYILNSKK